MIWTLALSIIFSAVLWLQCHPSAVWPAHSCVCSSLLLQVTESFENMAISLVKGQKLSQFVLFSPNVCYFVPRTLVIPIFSTWSLIQGFVKTTLKCADFRFLCENIGTTLFVLEVCYICPDFVWICQISGPLFGYLFPYVSMWSFVNPHKICKHAHRWSKNKLADIVNQVRWSYS